MNNILYLTNSNENHKVSSPEALAYQAIYKQRDVEKQLLAKYANGETISQVDFGFEYGKACAKYTVDKLNDLFPKEYSKDNISLIEKNIEVFARSVCWLNVIEFIRAISLLNEKLLEIHHFKMNENTLLFDINYTVATILASNVKNHPEKKQAVSTVFFVFFI